VFYVTHCLHQTTQNIVYTFWKEFWIIWLAFPRLPFRWILKKVMARQLSKARALRGVKIWLTAYCGRNEKKTYVRLSNAFIRLTIFGQREPSGEHIPARGTQTTGLRVSRKYGSPRTATLHFTTHSGVTGEHISRGSSDEHLFHSRVSRNHQKRKGNEIFAAVHTSHSDTGEQPWSLSS